MAENRSLAIVLFLFAGVALVAMSAVVKHFAADLPVGQIIFWRSFTALPFILGYMALQGEFPHALRTKRFRAHGLRMVVAVGAMACSFGALAYLSVAMATAIGFLAPVVMMSLAAIFLGEKLSRLRIVASVVGLVGVAVVLYRAIVVPDEGALIGTMLALGFALLMAVARVVVKDLTRTERPSTVASYFAIGGAVLGALTAFGGWAPMEWHDMAILSLAGLFGATSHILATEALARAPLSVLAPIEYTELVWAAGLDLLVFQVMPEPLAWVGMAIITASGLIIWMDRRS